MQPGQFIAVQSDVPSRHDRSPFADRGSLLPFVSSHVQCY